MTRRFEMDPGNQRWAFLYFYDRYSALCQWIGWLTVIGLVSAARQHNVSALNCFGPALIVNVVLQVAMIFCYEDYIHAKMTFLESPHTIYRYGLITFMAMLLLFLFIAGTWITVVNY